MIEGKHVRNSGRWLESGFPRSGWHCTSMEDAGAEGQLCEMCGVAEVRWLHKMVHEERPGILAVGLDCAQALGDDYERARRRTNAFSLERHVRDHWSERSWSRSEDGNYFTNARGYNFATFEAGGGFFGLRVRLENTSDDNDKIDGKRMYATVEAAMEAGPDAMFYARDRLTKGKTFDNWRALCGPIG